MSELLGLFKKYQEILDRVKSGCSGSSSSESSSSCDSGD